MLSLRTFCCNAVNVSSAIRLCTFRLKKLEQRADLAGTNSSSALTQINLLAS